ncbi:MAG: SRPBCC family protein [Acidimicrobiia bacterium]|nr:SRPBCC family protein [Acidimicrobiia bacterium]
MAMKQTEIAINRSPEDLWALTGDFGALGWMPGVESCEVEGDVRTISLMGMSIKEQMTRRDEGSRTLAYSIIEGPFPITRHESAITVDAGDGGSKVTWTVDVEPDELADVMIDIYGKALEALKAHVES